MQSNSNIMQREQYRYCTPGTRVLKSSSQKSAYSVRQHLIRYLPGIEIRMRYSGTRQKERLTVITTDNVRIHYWLSDIPEGVENQHQRYSLQNRNQSCTLEIDGEAEIISREEYYPYGGTAIWLTRSQIEACYKTLHYSGKERDRTGLVYYGYRYYAPWLLRWLTPDPAGEIDGMNLFSLARNNPITFNDIDGRMREEGNKLYLNDDEGFAVWMAQEGIDKHRKNNKLTAKEYVAANEDYRTLDKKNLLDKNVIIEPPTINYTCRIPGCSESFHRKNMYATHLSDVHKILFYKCDWPGCDKEYKHQESLYAHRLQHTSVRFRCGHRDCNASFNSRTLLSQHLSQHNMSYEVHCPRSTCASRFKTKGDLNRHIKNAHAREASFRCHASGCGKYFKSKDILNIHITYCHTKLNFQCPMCGLYLPSEYALDNHINTHTKEFTYLCKYPDCGRYLASINSRGNHERKVHGGIYCDARINRIT